MAEETESLANILKTLTAEQLKFVQVRMYERSDAAAADALHMPRSTVYGWENKQEINDAVRLALQDGVILGRERLTRLIPKAIDALDKELDARARRLEAAREVLDRTGIIAVQGRQVSGSVEAAIRVVGGVNVEDV